MRLKASASATFLFGDANPQQIVATTAAAGFSALEFQMLRPGDAAAFAPHVARAGLDVALMNIGVGDFTSGGSGLSGVPGRAPDFAAALHQTSDDADRLRARIVNIGPSRVPASMSRSQCVAQLLDNLRRTLDQLSNPNTLIAIEALNRRDFPDILIGTPEEALELMDELGSPRVVLQYDVYHAAMDGRDVLQDIQRMASRLRHVQFADCPGRHEPGTGSVDFRGAFEALRACGYRGYVGAEYIPSRALNDTFGWMQLL